MTEDTGWKCKNCGNFNVRTDKCPKCGNPKVNSQAPIMASFERSSSLECPKCRRIDNVSKVSVIVQSGTHQISGQVPVSHTYQDSDGWHERTSYESYGATQQSRLAHILTPIPPKVPSHMKNGPVMNFFENGFQIIVVSFTTLMGLALIVSAFTVAKDITGGVFRIVAGLAFSSPIIWAYIWSKKMIKASRDKYLESLKKWEFSIRLWDQLYYCSRDDCIFIPEEKLAFPISALNDVINWHPEPLSWREKLFN